MKRNKTVLLAVSAVLILTVLFQISVCALRITPSDKYIEIEEYTLGWDSLAVSVKADGSFLAYGAKQVSFGAPASTVASFESYPYPVITHRYSIGDVSCVLRQFAGCTDNGHIVVYSSLEAQNNGDDPVPFPGAVGDAPKVCGTLPDTVPPKDSALCVYVTLVKCSDFVAPTDAELTENVSFEQSLLEMEHHWDEIADGIMCIQGASALASDGYKNSIIYSVICGGTDEMSVFDGRMCENFDKLTPFEAFVLLGGGNEIPPESLETAAASLTRQADAVCENIETVSAPYGEICLFFDGDGGASLDRCLNALTQLKAFLSVSPYFGITDTKKYESAANALLYGTASAMKHTAEALPCDWQAADIAGDRAGTLGLCSDTSASSLCSWYIRCSAMGKTDSTYLNGEAKSSAEYAAGSLCALDIAVGAVFPAPDGTSLMLGHSIDAQSLCDGTVSVTGFLQDGEAVNVTFSAMGNVVTVCAEAEKPCPIILEIPFFKERIEYASCGFDYESGIVTAPAGTAEITVKLSEDIEEICEEARAQRILETALFKAYSADSTHCTSLSRADFDSAYKEAVFARNSTAKEKLTAAAHLEERTAKLSGIVSGYSFRPFDGTKDGGIIVATEVFQKFTLPKKGTVSRITLRGSMADPNGKRLDEEIGAAIYTLRDDGYTTGEMICSAQAQTDGDSIIFEFDFEASENREYALCVFSETGAFSLAMKDCDATGQLYVREQGEGESYNRRALDMEITVIQANRQELDDFYRKCSDTDVSAYTRESVKALRSAMSRAAELLRTPDASKDDCNKAYQELKAAFASLGTYASDKKTPPSPVVYVLVGITIAVLCITLIFAATSGNRDAVKLTKKSLPRENRKD